MVDYYGTLVTVKATAATTAGGHSLVEMWARGNAAPPWHVHHGNDEMFYVVEGHLTGLVRDEDGEEHSFPTGPGGMFYVPEGTPHSFVTDEESKFLVMTYRPGFEGYFVELGTVVDEYALPAEGAPTEEKLAEIAEVGEWYGMEIVGPPPV